MAEYDEIGRYIKDIAQSGLDKCSIPCIVEEVDVEKLICNVKSMDGSRRFINVRLKEVADLDNTNHGVLLIPKVGSRVVIDKMGINQTYVSMFSEIEFFQSMVGDSSSEIRIGLSKTGISLENKKTSVDLKDVLDSLLDTLINLQVQTAWGPSGPPLTNYTQDLQKIKQDLSKIIVSGSDNIPE